MIVTYGEALVDMIEQLDGRFAAVLSGSVYNFSLAVARQGLAVTYLNPLSADTFGQRFAVQLAKAGVTVASQKSSIQPSSLAMVTLAANNLATYTFHRASVADRDISAEQACALFPQGAELFHTGGLAMVPEDIERILYLVRCATKAGAIVSIDANMRPLVCSDLILYAAGVRHALSLADMIKVSDEDLHHLGFKDIKPIDAARSLFEGSNIKLIALTLGAQGAILISRSTNIHRGIPAGVKVVDTVGAGDSFWAGLIASLHRAGKLSLHGLSNLDTNTLEPALQAAIATASLNVMRAGCNPPTRAELDEYLLNSTT